MSPHPPPPATSLTNLLVSPGFPFWSAVLRVGPEAAHAHEGSLPYLRGPHLSSGNHVLWLELLNALPTSGDTIRGSRHLIHLETQESPWGEQTSACTFPPRRASVKSRLGSLLLGLLLPLLVPTASWVPVSSPQPDHKLPRRSTVEASETLLSKRKEEGRVGARCGCSHPFTSCSVSHKSKKTPDLEKVAQGPLTWNLPSLPELLRHSAATETVLMHKTC